MTEKHRSYRKVQDVLESIVAELDVGTKPRTFTAMAVGITGCLVQLERIADILQHQSDCTDKERESE